MKATSYGKLMLVLAASAWVSAGCVVREVRYAAAPPLPGTQVVVSGPPPPPVVETVTVQPAPGLVWVAGFWAWGGGGWYWRSGVWVRPPRPGVVWVAPRYVYHGHGYYWVHGGWR